MPQVRGNRVFRAKALGGSGESRLAGEADFTSPHRRCAVDSSYRPTGGGGAHAKYLARSQAQEREAGAEAAVGYLGRGSDKEPFFDATRNRIGPDEVARELDAGARRWHVVLNPLDSTDRNLDMRQFARDFMSAVENDLGTSIRWYAVVHKADRIDRVGARHLHFAFSSKSPDTGRDFRLAKEYVQYGLRLRAS